MAETAVWDVRRLLDAGRRAQNDEDAWIAEHEGALAASALGGCLRAEKFRLMGQPKEKDPTAATLRRWRWGMIYQEEVKQQALAAGRKPRVNNPVEIEVDGVVIRGFADLVFTEGVLEVKTTSAWEMHQDHLPFRHLIQLGTYMTGLQRPGQLLYGSFNREWAFDMPQVPDIWEPWVREVARLFREHPEADPRPFPCERLYCASCPYESACPTDEPAPSDAPVTELEQQIVERYLAVRERAKAAGKEEEEAKARILGLRETRGVDDKGTCALRLSGRMVLLKQSQQNRVDYAALDATVRDALPRKIITVNTITTKEAENDG